eukprot:Em0001g2398a
MTYERWHCGKTLALNQTHSGSHVQCADTQSSTEVPVFCCSPTQPNLVNILQKLVSSLDADEECAEILLQAWYLGNGALAGTHSAVLRALHFALEIDPDSVKVAVGKGQRFIKLGTITTKMNSIKQTKKAIFPVRVDWDEQLDVLWCTEIERYGLGTRDIGRYSLGTRSSYMWGEGHISSIVEV